jgi:hypothetical protein
MHLVTSSIFLSSLSAYLTPSSQSIFLTSYFRVSLAWWVARGRPGFDIPEYFSAKTSCPVMPGPYPIPSEVTLPNTSFSMGNFFGLSKASNGSSLSPSEYTPEMLTPNPWLPIIQSTLLHPDDHLCKMQRALAHFANLYGGRTPGLPDFAETELPGAERLDGTLFIRIAGLTAQKLGRVREGEKYVFWGR